MKIWFDILTPKQVMFFHRTVDMLRRSGHDVLCTSRRYREAEELAKIMRFELQIVGSHGGAERYDKLRESANRVFELAKVVSDFSPDAAVTFSSPEGARVAFGLGIPHLGFNDSPHAEAVARLTVPLMNKLLCPWIIPYSAWTGYGISKNRIARYRALDPAAWLKNREIISEKNDGGGKKKILIRIEESKASYIADRKLGHAGMIDDLVNEMSKSASVIILCRYQDQVAEMRDRYHGRAQVPLDVVDGTSLISSSDLFIGAGGTMTAEAALMGKPTISIAPVRFYVEQYLIKSGLARRALDSKMLVRLAKRMISDSRLLKAQKKRGSKILAGMEDPTDRLLAEIRKAAP